MAELERTWAIASAHAEGVSIRKIAAAAGLGPTRVHAIVRDADIDSLDAALGELRSLYGWPAPVDPDGSHDDELAGRELIAQRLGDEVEWLHDCTNWLAQLELGEYPPVINLRPKQITPSAATSSSSSAASGECCGGSPPISMSPPAPAASTSLSRPRLIATCAPNAAGV